MMSYGSFTLGTNVTGKHKTMNETNFRRHIICTAKTKQTKEKEKTNIFKIYI